MPLVSRLVAVFILIVSASPALAGDPPPVEAADKAAIRQVIQSQIDAFQKDDGDAAFAFATEALRKRFGNARTFMEMVRNGYQPVYRPSQVTYGGIDRTDGATVQHVLVVGPDGNLHEALYFMEHEQDGKWLIDGCLLLCSEQKTS